MKHLITILTIGISTFSIAQHTVYIDKGKKIKNQKEHVLLELRSSQVKTSTKVGELLNGQKWKGSLVPNWPEIAGEVAKEIISVGYKLSKAALENRKDKFSAEYEKEASFIECLDHSLPVISFQREISGEAEFESALRINLEPKQLVDSLNYFYYQITGLDLSAAKAKSTRKSSVFDYSIELQITYVVDTTAKTVSFSPLQVHSVGYKSPKFQSISSNEYRTDLVPIPIDAIILKVGMKIVETNPQKINAQRLLDMWNKFEEDNGDSVSKLIALVLDKGEEVED